MREGQHRRSIILLRILIRFSGGYCGGVTPDPIPNSEVKPSCADGTAGETLWESRSLPDLWAGSPLRDFRPFFLRRIPVGVRRFPLVLQPRSEGEQRALESPESRELAPGQAGRAARQQKTRLPQLGAALPRTGRPRTPGRPRGRREWRGGSPRRRNSHDQGRALCSRVAESALGRTVRAGVGPQRGSHGMLSAEATCRFLVGNSCGARALFL